MLERIESVRSNVVSASGPQKYVEFLTSLHYFYSKKGKITPSQEAYFINIERAYGEEAVMEESLWSENYNDDLRVVAIRCANYYSAQPEAYFSKIFTKVLGDPSGHILSKRQFTKMCMNKYAKRVLDEYDKPCVYSTGELVELRKTNRLDLMSSDSRSYYGLHKNAMNGVRYFGVVLEADAKPITRSCKGAKVYKVKFIQHPAPVFVCERDIKKARKKSL